GRIYAFGGNTNLSGATSITTVEAYTIDRDHWLAVAPLAIARSDMCAALGTDGRVYAVGGEGKTAPERSVEIYGPVIALARTSASSGDTVSIVGSNFAADAPVAFTFDGAPVAIGTTDATGTVTLSFRVPVGASGPHVVGGLDDRSQFPVSAPL